MKPTIQAEAPDRAVLVLGSGYGALKVVNDLAQAGIPAVWVTGAGHFLELPGDMETPQDWPDDLDYQFRPLYLRVKHHPLVTPLPRASVRSVEKSDQDYSVTVSQAPMYIDYDLCTGCGRCVEVCPLQGAEHTPLSRTPDYCPSRALELDKRICGPCRQGCPLGVNVQAYMALTAAGRFQEALDVIRRDNPLPGVCGRVCHHPCEDQCRRGELDQPLAIRDIKRFLYDYEVAHASGERSAAPPEGGHRVAVVGSGPAGLTAAHFMNRAGLDVTIFEALSQPGGMLRAGINAFRLPRKVLDAEIQILEDAGVRIKTNVTVRSVDDLLEEGFRAVLLATGTHADLKLGLDGENLDGVNHCVKFLSRVNMIGAAGAGRRTVVIGGGNSAMDAARSAVRLGANEVTVLAVEREGEMPAHPQEILEAREEGVVFRLGAAPVAFQGNGRVERVVCRPAHWETSGTGSPELIFDAMETFDLEADAVIVAIGQRPHLDMAALDDQVRTCRGGRVDVCDGCATSRPGVFAAGDVVTGPSTVVGSMAEGRRAAEHIIALLNGEPQTDACRAEERGVGEWDEVPEDAERIDRCAMPQRRPEERCRDFDEVDTGLTTEQAVAEASRCLQCGVCAECRACEEVCADIGAIDHFRTGRTLSFDCPTVIVADEGERPERVGLPGDITLSAGNAGGGSDLMSVMMAGAAAAGRAIALGADLRVASLPEPLEPIVAVGDDRYGFFLCSCNGTMAPESALEEIRAMAERVPGMRHSEVIPSLCHPDGAERVARVKRDAGLSRVIVASCVCCPLEFQCISCNEQRNRAKILLFERHGVPRSHLEMINIRDHLYRDHSEAEIVERARDLLRASFIRYKFMESLRQGITEMGHRILILGGSDVGLSCAENLALMGFKVRLVHRCGLPDREMPPDIDARNPDLRKSRMVKHVREAVIQEIKGALGNYVVTAVEGNTKRRWQADVVCLTDEHLIQLAIDTGKTGLKKFYRYNFSFFHSPKAGLYRVRPVTLQRVSPQQAGAALAAEVAATTSEAFLMDHQLSPRVDPERCRGCGRCADICPFDAIHLVPGEGEMYTAEVLRHNCVGCGGCVGRCPVTALDMPYFSNQFLKEMIAGAVAGG